MKERVCASRAQVGSHCQDSFFIPPFSPSLPPSLSPSLQVMLEQLGGC